jgi:hypothetical protein
MIYPVGGREISLDPTAPAKVSATAGVKAVVGNTIQSLSRPKVTDDLGCPMAAPVFTFMSLVAAGLVSVSACPEDPLQPTSDS